MFQIIYVISCFAFVTREWDKAHKQGLKFQGLKYCFLFQNGVLKQGDLEMNGCQPWQD